MFGLTITLYVKRILVHWRRVQLLLGNLFLFPSTGCILGPASGGHAQGTVSIALLVIHIFGVPLGHIGYSVTP